MKTDRENALPQTLDRDYELWGLVHLTASAIGRARELELRSANINITRAAVLLLVESSKGQATPIQLSRWLFRERNTISGLLRRMQGEDLLIMTPDQHKRNVIRLSLTKKGEATLRSSLEKRKAISCILSCLNAQERHALNSALIKLQIAAFKQLGITHPTLFPWTRRSGPSGHNRNAPDTSSPRTRPSSEP